MKKIISFSLFLLFCLSACNNEDKTETSASDIIVVSGFIKSALRGDYENAKTFMIADSLSLARMNNIARVNLSAEEKRGLAAASIIIHTRIPVNDSTTVVIYSNSYKNNWDTLRALRVNGRWLVDFNYLFDHDMDTLINYPVNKTDSIK
jgi:hypothetical protein